jgi:hypothetical protein
MWTYGHTYRVVRAGGGVVDGTLGLAQSGQDDGGAGLWLYVPDWEQGQAHPWFLPMDGVRHVQHTGQDETWPSRYQSEQATADELARRMRGE